MRGVHTFLLEIDELQKELARVREKGFDDAFALFCAETFACYSYPPGNRAAARMHAFYLRLFMEEVISGSSGIETVPVRLQTTFREVSRLCIERALSSTDLPGIQCCRTFVRCWFEALSSR